MSNVSEDLKAIIFAALFHDVGKLYERIDIESNIKNNYKYEHARLTEQFLIDVFGENNNIDLNNIFQGCNSKLYELSSYHHNPRNIIEKIIQQADWQAAGHERKEDEYRLENSSDEKIKLYYTSYFVDSILNYININNDNRKFERYKFETENLVNFFINIKNDNKEIYIGENKFKQSNIHTIQKEKVKKICENFKSSLKNVKSDLFNYNDFFRNILKNNLWCIPESRKYSDLQDVSLYEHSRLTAILSACLYVYHKENNSFDKLEDNNIKKYLLFGIDIAGIQNFIFNIGSKGAYKNIKGRSFFISFLPYLVATIILDSIGMDDNQILYITGGHFYLLLPNIKRIKDTIKDKMNEINYELLLSIGEEFYIRYEMEEFLPKELTSNDPNNNFLTIWENMQKKLSVSDRKKYIDRLKDNYVKIFYCEKNKLEINFEDIGRKLRDKNDIILISKEKNKYSNKLFNYTFDINKYDEKYSYNNKDKIVLLNENNNINFNYYFMPYGGFDSFEKEFDEVAKESVGPSYLGILKMDVDNLGNIFSKGLINYIKINNDQKDKNQNYYTISRISTLSMYLNYFFSLTLSKIVDQYKNKVIVVYSGGDDVFILGQWNLLPEISINIYKCFKKFTCNNPSFSISAGISIFPGKYPLAKGAELADNAERQAKKFERKVNGNLKTKDSISFMNRAFDWDYFEEINNLIENKINKIDIIYRKAVINRINMIASLHNKNFEDMKKNNKISKKLSEKDIMKMIESDRWRWIAVYSLNRMAKKISEEKNGREEVEELLKLFLSKNKTDIPNIEYANVIGKWSEYLNRKK